MNNDDLSRRPMPGPGSGTGSPLRISRIRSPPSLTLLWSRRRRSGVKEWASAVSPLPAGCENKTTTIFGFDGVFVDGSYAPI